MNTFTRSAADVDDLAHTLRRLNTGGTHVIHAMVTPEEAQARRGRPPPEMPASPPWAQDEALFRVPSYGTGKRSNSPMLTRPASKPQLRKDSHQPSERRPSQGGTSASGFSLYPAPSKPPTRALPPIPGAAKKAQREGSFASMGDDDGSSSRYSEPSHDHGLPLTPLSSHTPTLDELPEYPGRVLPQKSVETFTPPRPALTKRPSNPLDVGAWKVLATKAEKGVKDPAIYFFDVSATAATLASKHGNKLVKVWSIGSGAVLSTIKISCYTTAQARSREYFVRSHAILSEPSTLMAIATGFGDALEIWDWSRPKKLQTIDHADRWAAVRSNMHEAAWSSLVTYSGKHDTLHLHASTAHPRTPFRRARTIELRHAGLPVLPKYPELAFSSTSPLLVLASGPRPPRVGHPPPERETVLAVWEINDTARSASRDSASTIIASDPHRVVTPWAHTELDTALPSGLATYGSIAVSLWIPASYRAVPASRGAPGFNLQPIAVRFRHVLVWDFSANSTHTFRIPNTGVACVSPDCRFVAYCDTRGTDGGARGTLVILEATSGKPLWCWPDPEATAGEVGARAGFEQMERLGRVTELSFAADGGFLYVGDLEGNIGVYEVREVVGGAGRVSVWPAV